MNHLLLGLPPEHIRLDPYTPTWLMAPPLSARDVGLRLHPEAWITLSPNSGSYVGGDIAAGLLCTELATDSEAITLFIDIGTNGEIVVGNRDFLLGCACSAGPAFEGGSIGCGMTAAVGAIESVKVDAETGEPSYRTIGRAPPRGICGSGMIDLVANLFATGWLDRAGKLTRDRTCRWIEVDDRHARYLITRSDHGDIYLGEHDLENIVRAKAAIYSACDLLLGKVDLSFQDVDRVYIAGGFARYLDLEKSILLGLLPDLPRTRFRFIGNASLTGSHMVAVSRKHRQLQLDLMRRMTYVDLSSVASYMDDYVAAMFIPHTDVGRFPSVRRM